MCQFVTNTMAVLGDVKGGIAGPNATVSYIPLSLYGFYLVKLMVHCLTYTTVLSIFFLPLFAEGKKISREQGIGFGFATSQN